MNFRIFFTLLLTLHFSELATCSKSRKKIKEKYARLPEIYSYQETLDVNEVENEKFDDFLGEDGEPQPSLESYLSVAISDATHLEWKSLPESEMPSGDVSDLTAEFTTINVPLLYGNDAEKYGIEDESLKKSYFAIYLRKYHWGTINRHETVKHVILVAGGPGESGQSWIRKLQRLSRQYGRSNLILYVADHRGVYKSRDIVELIKRETPKGGKSRTSWRRVKRSERVVEEDKWLKGPIEFERDVGYPLVSMTCSNAARDLGLISLVIRNKMLIHSTDKFYLHAQSYGTQVSTRTLILLPDFYEGILLEGLATMELVKESAEADFGILSSCAEDRVCSQMFYKTDVPADRLPLTSPFDLKNLLEGMADKPHNRVCRDIFQTHMRQYVYSETISFWDAVHLSFYELLSDDFLNPYTGDRGDFYPGMLVLHLIRDMYYCEDVERFRRQVRKAIEMIAISVRGLKQPYVKTPQKSRPVDPKQATSFFVQTYINIHEAFDMRRMTHPSERGYCERSNRGDLINQCPIWREQVRRLEALRQLSSESSSASSSGVKKKKTKKRAADVMRRDKLDKFEGISGKGKGNESRSTSKTSTSSSSSSSDDSVATAGSGEFYKSVMLKLFNGAAADKKSSRKRRGKAKNSKKKSRDVKGKKSPKERSDYNNCTYAEYSSIEVTRSQKLRSAASQMRRFYYDVDDLAYDAPTSSKTKFFVTVGSLDIKTPLLEARRLLARIQAPVKALFELKNVAHSTDPCRTEIIRAMVGGGGERVAMELADECVRELGRRRKLDWDLQGVKQITRDDWIQ